MSHHKKHSTFANVPFAESNGLDDFIGFSVEETNLKQEIRELKDIVDEKDKIIQILRHENNTLKNKLKNSQPPRKSSTTSTTPSDDNNTLNITNLKSVKLQSPTTQTTEGSSLFSKTFSQNMPIKNNRNTLLTKSEEDDELKHQISASLNNFLDTLDFKFKEDDENDTVVENNIINIEDNTEENEIYIIHPPTMMDIENHLPQLRRSSLTEEEQEEMELQAVNDMKSNKNQNNQYIATNPYNNVIFNDSSVNNMNMNIINHHNHQEVDRQVSGLKNEIVKLQKRIEQMKLSKMELIVSTSNEMNHLRSIIRNINHTK